MSLLDHPEARALLADATLSPEAVEGCQDRLTAFLQRYLPLFYRIEQRAHAITVIRGLLWTSWTGACRACPTAGSPATTSSAGPRSSAPPCAGVTNATCWMSPVTPRSGTWSGGDHRAGRRESAGNARCRSCEPTSGP